MQTHTVADVTPDQVKAAVEQTKRKFWKLHNCSLCNYPCGYHFRGEEVTYDRGCWCVTYGPVIVPSDFGSIAGDINMQNDEWRKRMWDDISTPEAA